MKSQGKTLRVVMQAEGETPTAELYVYDVIGVDPWGLGVSAAMVAEALRGAKADGAKALDVYVNSPGGSVFDGVAIYNELKNFGGRVTVTVRGMALSAASLLAMAGDTIRMEPGSMMMIHNSAALVMGNAADMQAMAATLEKIDGQMAGIYAKRAGRRPETLRAMMAAETWMTAEEAVAQKLADEAVKGAAAQARAEGEEIVMGDPATWPEHWRRVAAGWTEGPFKAQDGPGLKGRAQTEKSIEAEGEQDQGGEAMDAKEITMELLRSQRPDLVAALTTELEAKATTAVADAVGAERGRCLAIAKEARALGLGEAGEKLIEAGATSDAAAAALRQARLEAITAAAPQSPGTGDDGALGGGSAGDRFNALVAEQVAAGKSKARAIAAVVREHPTLHAAYLKEANAKRAKAA